MTKDAPANWKKYLPDRFIGGLLLMILLAWIVPGIGDNHTIFNLKEFTHYGIALLFFFYGLRLSPEKLVNDMKIGGYTYLFSRSLFWCFRCWSCFFIHF